jgi:hypothetical protein
MSSGRPPTLWWLLILAACAVPDSITSGYSVPCTRKRASSMPPLASSKMRMNSSPMALRLSSGSVTPASLSKKRSAARTWISSMPWWRSEGLDHLVAFVLAHQAGVDEHAGELVADRLVHQGGGDRGVHATGQGADDPAVTDLGADLAATWVSMKLAIVHAGGCSRRRRRGSARAQPGRAGCGPPRGGTARRGCVGRGSRWPPPGIGGGCRGDGEPLGGRHDGVEVAHPHRLVGREASAEQHTPNGSDDVSSVRPYSPTAGVDGAAELLGHQLGAVTDAEDRDAQVVHPGVDAGGAFDVHRLGATGEDHRRPGRAATSAAVIVVGTISEYTWASRTRRAMSWAYWAPKSTTSTGPVSGRRVQRMRGRPALSSGHRGDGELGSSGAP